MAITFRTNNNNVALTHAQMDENFTSLYYSSSLHDSNTKLRLWFKAITGPDVDYDEVSLPTPGDADTVTIENGANNRLITANGPDTLYGEENLTFNGNILNLTGIFTPADTNGNISIGTYPGINATGGDNVLVGNYAGQNLESTGNVAVGNVSLLNALGQDNTAIGGYSLTNLSTGHSNTALGFNTAENVEAGMGNIYIGYAAGPATSTPSQNNKLYINNSADDTPLILGDFATGQVTFNSQVSASVFSGSFVGNGSALTGVTAEWDGTRNGNAEITGSLIVSGGVGSTVNFTNVSAISGSTFSGSFVGDGSGLTGIVANSEWDGTRNGNAEITGSFIVSGSLPTITLRGVTTIDSNITIYNPKPSSIGIGTGCLNVNRENSIGIGTSVGTGGSGRDVIVIGNKTGTRAGDNTIYIGTLAGQVDKGTENVAIGVESLQNSLDSTGTVATGFRALYSLNSPAVGNTAVGNHTAYNLKSGNYNTVVGGSALDNINGESNTAIGYKAGSNKLEKGNGNVYIGADSGHPNPEGGVEYNQLYIDNRKTPDALIRGDFEERTLTLNALQIFMPELLDIQQDYVGVNALPTGALYTDGGIVIVKTW